MTNVSSFLTYIGGSALLLAAIAWLVRSLFVHLLDKDAERYKEMLRTESALASRLHKERADVILEIYGNLVDLYNSIRKFVAVVSLAGEPSKDELASDVYDKLLAFTTYFQRNNIYLEPRVCGQIEEFVEAFVGPATKFNVARRIAQSDESGESSKDMHETWFAAVDKMEKEIPAAKIALENDFRDLLGIAKIEQPLARRRSTD